MQKSCSRDGCGAAAVSRGFCPAHYQAWYRENRTAVRFRSPQRKRPIAERFWMLVAVGAPDACWEWRGQLSRDGYGRFRVGEGRSRAHRVAHELSNGPIPGGLCVCHHCDNRLCCNPAHLWLGTNEENMADMVAKGRAARLQGENSPHPKLTNAAVLEIRRVAVGGNRPADAELGIRFGVCEETVRKARIGATWKHVS